MSRPQQVQQKTTSSRWSAEDKQKEIYWLFNVKHDNFNMMVGLVIVFNAIVIGMETDLGGEDFIFFEHFFCIFFIVEMAMRIAQLGCSGYVSDNSNLFDGSLVISGTCDLYIIPMIVGPGKKGGAASMLRLLRMLRVMRILRLFKVFKELMVILNAFLNAFSAVMWVSVLTLIMIYVLSVFLTQTVGHHAHIWGVHEEKVQIWFGSIGHSMRTLFICLTLAEWDEIALTLQEQVNGLLVFAFAILYVMIAGFTMVSLIIGIISEAIVAAQEEDRKSAEDAAEEEKQEGLKELKKYLEGFDSNNDGYLALAKVEKKLIKDKTQITKLNTLDIPLEAKDLMDLVRKLAKEADEAADKVKIEDLVSALDEQKGLATAMNIFDLKHKVIELGDQQTRIKDKLQQLVSVYRRR